MDILIDLIIWAFKSMGSSNRSGDQSAQAKAQLELIRQRMAEMQRRQSTAQTGAAVASSARVAAQARGASPAVRARPGAVRARQVQSARRPMPVTPVFSVQRPAGVAAVQGMTPPAMVQSPLQPSAITSPPPSPILQPARSAALPSNFVGAAAIARWMKPETLQQQFMLTEIFQPPVALRSEPPGSRD